MKENDYLCTENNHSVQTMNIKEKIKEHGKTSVEIANALGMTQANFSMQMKNLNTNMGVKFLLNIAKELGISVSELIDDDAVAPDHISLNIGGQSVIYTKEKEDKK